VEAINAEVVELCGHKSLPLSSHYLNLITSLPKH